MSKIIQDLRLFIVALEHDLLCKKQVAQVSYIKTLLLMDYPAKIKWHKTVLVS